MSMVQSQGESQGQLRQQSQGQAQPPPVVAAPVAAPPRPPASHVPVRSPLVARHADSVMWFARYLERVENLARLIDAVRGFGDNRADNANWRNLLRVAGDEAAFAERYGDSDDGLRCNVARFYLLGPDVGGLRHMMDMVRENARVLRALISTEMWRQINMFHAACLALGEDDVAPQNLSATCAMIKEGVQAHTGITDGTFYRDQSWSFYAIGRHLERAERTAGILDMGLPTAEADGPAYGRQWDVLLRAAGGYHAYRRVYPQGYYAADIVGFLLLDGAFPRSVSLNIGQLQWHLHGLRGWFGLSAGAAALERADELRGIVTGTEPGELVAKGLGPFLNGVRDGIAALHADIGQAFCQA